MLGEKLKEGRIAKGYSQEEVAEKLQITRQAISKWENNRTAPDIDTLVKLSDLYEISLDRLLREEETVQEKEKKADDVIEDAVSNDKEAKNERLEEKHYIEILFLIVLLIVSCLIPILGIVVSVGVIFLAKKRASYSRILKILALICLIISIYNLTVILNGMFFHSGRATVS